MPAPKLTESIILAAIEGFESQKTKLDQEIAELRTMLSGGTVEPVATPEPAPRKRRRFSAESRRKMALAQKARWANIKGHSESVPAEPAPTEPPKAKRKLSAAGRKAISEATKKRWALQKAAEAARSAPANKASKNAAVTVAKKASAKAAKKTAPGKRAVKKTTKKTTPVAAPTVSEAAV